MNRGGTPEGAPASPVISGNTPRRCSQRARDAFATAVARARGLFGLPRIDQEPDSGAGVVAGAFGFGACLLAQGGAGTGEIRESARRLEGRRDLGGVDRDHGRVEALQSRAAVLSRAFARFHLPCLAVEEDAFALGRSFAAGGVDGAAFAGAGLAELGLLVGTGDVHRLVVARREPGGKTGQGEEDEGFARGSWGHDGSFEKRGPQAWRGVWQDCRVGLRAAVDHANPGTGRSVSCDVPTRVGPWIDDLTGNLRNVSRQGNPTPDGRQKGPGRFDRGRGSAPTACGTARISRGHWEWSVFVDT